PVAWYGAILNLGRPFADGNRIDNLSQPALRGAALGLTHLPRCPQVRHQLLFQHTACLNEEASIDRLVRYLHAWVGRELLLQPAGDLLRRPLERKLLRVVEATENFPTTFAHTSWARLWVPQICLIDHDPYQ